MDACMHVCVDACVRACVWEYVVYVWAFADRLGKIERRMCTFIHTQYPAHLLESSTIVSTLLSRLH